MPIPKPLLLTGQNLAFQDARDTVPARLTDHARTMKQGVYQIAEDFYVAVGYGQSNMTMVVGTDGVLIIDCLETEETARQALGDLRKVSDKPIKALIYSHSHPDHISGVRAILDPADVEQRKVEIYEHERLLTGIRGNPSLGLVPPLRLAYTFGLGLDRGPEGWVETGLGTQFNIGTTGFLPPTTLFQRSLDIEVAGIKVQLREAPSESDDESEGVQLQVDLRCTDTGTSYGIAIRSEVAEVLAAALPNATVIIQTTESTLRGLLAGRISWPRPVEDGTATLTRGTAEEAARFRSLFDPPIGELPAVALR